MVSAVQEEGQQRKAAAAPLLQVPFTSELGGVAPVFVTPGVWSRDDMRNAARAIWFGATSNAGANCITPRALIMSAEWPQVQHPYPRMHALHACVLPLQTSRNVSSQR